MEKINFIKINGAGNDFILIDADKNKNVTLNSKIIKDLCDRRKGIGADGILLFKSSLTHDFELEYYNSDGSLGSLCGNGSRCSIQYFFNTTKEKKTSTNFLCKGLTYKGKIEKDGLITFFLGNPSDIKLNLNIKINDKEFPAHFINTGSPHAIIFWEDIKKYFQEDFKTFDVNKFGRQIRFLNEFKPEGTNVNFVDKNIDGILYIRTFERGVEEETLACGTGTVASAIVTSIIYNLNSPLTFTTFGNDKLIVNFKKKNDFFTKITLTGPVKINYIGTYNFLK
jgi:diaminopimelate epimerase